MRPRERRIAALEAAKRARAKTKVPRQLFVGMFETQSDARERFNAMYPDRPHNHAALCIPAKPTNAEQEEAFETRLHAQQARLVSEARRASMAIVADKPASTIVNVRQWPTATAIRPNGPHVTWKANA